jgi:hypothetical protein
VDGFRELEVYRRSVALATVLRGLLGEAEQISRMLNALTRRWSRTPDV